MSVQYEAVIQAVLRDESLGISQLRETLVDVDIQTKQRIILNALDKDNRFAIHALRKETKMTYIADIVNMLRDYVNTGDIKKKKKFGDVLTPIWLVEEMLDKLPSHVWCNPALKWLDSCNGLGIFPAIIIKRLMHGLVGFEPSDDLRYKHIVENMLYVGELQPKSMFLFVSCFDPQNEYQLNAYTGSFVDVAFDAHMKKVWGVDAFDIIVGNPPYQDIQVVTGKRGGGTPLWDRFVEKYLKVLVKDGYLVVVHPAAWRNIDGKTKYVQTLLKSKQVQYLEIHNTRDGLKTFGATTRYDWYCLKNSPNVGIETAVKCEDGTIDSIDLATWDFIPNGMFHQIADLFARAGEPTVEILNSHTAYEHRKKWMNKVETAQHIYPCVQNINVQHVPSCFWYSTTNANGHFGVAKVIFARFGINTYIDETGAYGLCEDCSAIVDAPTVLPQITEVLQSPAFKNLMKFCDVNGIRDTPINRKVLLKFSKDFWKKFIPSV